MHGLLAAFGSFAARLTAESASEIFPGAVSRTRAILSADSNAIVVLSAPRHSAAKLSTLKIDAGPADFILDGYLIVNQITSTSQEEHLREFGETYLRAGAKHALSSVVAGAFNLAIIDNRTGQHRFIADPFGSIPVYVASNSNGAIVCTNPHAIADFDGIAHETDWRGVAEWCLLGYPIGERFLHRSIRTLPPGSLVSWEPQAHSVSMVRAGTEFDRILPDAGAPPPVQKIGDLLRAACERLSRLDGPTAHLQSGGMDSRAILAAWPNTDLPACYTYGVSGSAEVEVAKMVAERKNASLTYWRSTAGQVADALQPMFSGNGLFVYPDRYLVAKNMAENGFRSVLDGYLGDVLLGGTYYTNDQYFPNWSVIPRLITRLVDSSVSRIGLDAISEAIYDDICDLRDPSELKGLVSPDFVEFLINERQSVLADIHTELSRLSPENDSVSILFRNFLIANRGRHAIAQQAVMCRQHVTVLLPFTNDFPLLKALLSLRPQDTAYRRYYIKLFRHCFSEYASIPYDSTMLPLSCSAFQHKWSAVLSSRGIRIPRVTGSRISRVKPIDWNSWIRQSDALRNTISESLVKAGIDNGQQTRVELDNIRKGTRNASGKLLHLASIARWTARNTNSY